MSILDGITLLLLCFTIFCLIMSMKGGKNLEECSVLLVKAQNQLDASRIALEEAKNLRNNTKQVLLSLQYELQALEQPEAYRECKKLMHKLIDGKES